jgi:glycosyltransferase involved in cell wall biosynthesis
MKISAIVATYNQPGFLRLCIRSLSVQSMLPSEILVADDGSGIETRDAVHEMTEELKESIPVRHIWHEDDGFQKPKIMNEAVRNASGEYLVFIDGDCMAHPDFIRAHVERSDPRAILAGRRAEIGADLTGRLLKEERVLNQFRFELLLDSMRGRSRRVEESFPIRHPWLRRILNRDRITRDGVWGCNFSIGRQLFFDINGYDEDILAAEDNDLGIRVLNLGGEVRSVRGLAIVFHMYHDSRWSFASESYLYSLGIIRRRIENRESRCVNGIVKA